MCTFLEIMLLYTFNQLNEQTKMSQTKLTIIYFKFLILISIYKSLSSYIDSETHSETLQSLEADFEIFAVNPYDYPFRIIQLHTFILNTINKFK